ncbi:tRNA synthetases class I (C) catalytic domain-containing protein [Flagelloscypha sp. PMI_526]|nr:tRNA synthetases class I (C) catalytic domain-containing protein [Flagelloscypha sp. PMI_526]
MGKLEWSVPQPAQEEPVLHVYNSLTKRKDKFVPKNGRIVKWYNCGPTVYDASHMGHARNYVSQDVLRRILSDYFGYDVHFVQNVTDIDDKIIERARQNHLFDLFREETKSIAPPLLSQVQDAFNLYLRTKVAKGLPESDLPIEPGTEEASWTRISSQILDAGWKKAGLAREEKFEMYFQSAAKAHQALAAAHAKSSSENDSQAAAHLLIDEARDVLTTSLDAQYKSTISDPAISRNLAQYWEKEFFNDMARLNVREPDTITRVTEFIPEIVQFVDKVIANGYAYEAQGSVYFNTAHFDQAQNHSYAKLEPGKKNNLELLASGEGSLTSHVGQRSPADFALWKATKPGEPSWPSPWGQGRPGWHIECSVMASHILGENMDIHSGGIDLTFPHHDNEMAQSEAFHDCENWVNYFLHTGHLHIDGLKMSKSLKNFITIDEILKKFTPRQLRLSFIVAQWSAKVDFSESLMLGEVRSIETNFNNFFTNVKAFISQHEPNATPSEPRHKFGDAESSLIASYYDAQHAFRVALCDSFNTPDALAVLRDLVSKTNVYMNTRDNDLNIEIVQLVARWITKMLRIFGLSDGDSNEIGWGQSDGSSSGVTNVNREEILMPYLRALSTFRDGVRQLAIAKEGSALKDILALCDKLRDTDLVPLGVALDDQDSGKALVKLVPPAELQRARDEKKAQIEAKAAKKAAAAEMERQKRLQKLEKGRTPPEEMFKPPNVPEGTYQSWDDKGVPLTDGEGKELSKNQMKKVKKEWDAQQKAHAEFLDFTNTESKT